MTNLYDSAKAMLTVVAVDGPVGEEGLAGAEGPVAGTEDPVLLGPTEEAPILLGPAEEHVFTIFGDFQMMINKKCKYKHRCKSIVYCASLSGLIT